MNLFKKKKTTKIKKHSLCSFQNEPYDDRFIQKYKIEMKIETKWGVKALVFALIWKYIKWF